MNKARWIVDSETQVRIQDFTQGDARYLKGKIIQKSKIYKKKNNFVDRASVKKYCL